MTTGQDTPYKDVRALARGLGVIEALSEMGWAKVGELSTAVDIDRSSLYRLINTLIQLGYVVRRKEDGAVALTVKIAHLAAGLRDGDVIAQIAAPFMRDLTKEVLWPSDFASFIRGSVTIRFSTHQISPMSVHRGVIGKNRHLFRSAIGSAILSAMTPAELDAALDIVERVGGEEADEARNRHAVNRLVESVRAAGYASSIGALESNISAIALPVFGPDRRVAGAMNLIFFRRAMTSAEAAARYLPAMKHCVTGIETALVKRAAEEEGAANADPVHQENNI
ncbi:IclR family transcriptional regulator domain-containing protein [Sinisalibacter aestuarii]|uniref:Transcriptional regulator n=1 Tax=Sinisalibacter aestuarii TaxID=2949426 RepID=A0ABQ5LTF6_9RHOB|nr:IclR family transcriptional regulator C-terminal domain-containing protein [Sinisalibacter aestuarii]GKY88274.1 hypothetical protein STA1M1_21430 [Sinisalibacter aestuarii]